MEEWGYHPGLLGAGLAAPAGLTYISGTAEFSGTCFSSPRSGRRLKKTRKYDIITTPAERVEMAPLNEEDDEDEDSTVFDIKYRYGTGAEASSGPEGTGWQRVHLCNTERSRLASVVLILWLRVWLLGVLRLWVELL